MAGIREIATMTVVIEAADGHRAVFSLAELCPDFVDRVTLWRNTKDNRSHPAKGLFASSFLATNSAGAGCVKSRRLPFIALVGFAKTTEGEGSG
jgi:hypothetical protein